MIHGAKKYRIFTHPAILLIGFCPCTSPANLPKNRRPSRGISILIGCFGTVSGHRQPSDGFSCTQRHPQPGARPFSGSLSWVPRAATVRPKKAKPFRAHTSKRLVHDTLIATAKHEDWSYDRSLRDLAPSRYCDGSLWHGQWPHQEDRRRDH